MKSLGIRIEDSGRENEDILAPAYPLLAASYTRNGFIRLAAAGKKEKKSSRN